MASDLIACILLNATYRQDQKGMKKPIRNEMIEQGHLLCSFFRAKNQLIAGNIEMKPDL